MRKLPDFDRFLRPLTSALSGPSALAFLPALSLGAFWLGGERALVSVTLGVPLMFAVSGIVNSQSKTRAGQAIGGVLPSDQFNLALSEKLEIAQQQEAGTACIAIAIDGFSEVVDIHGQAAADHIHQQFCSRVLSMIRDDDIAMLVGDDGLMIGLHPSQQLDLEACIQMSGRIQSAVEEPIMLNGIGLYLTCSIGFSMNKTIAGDTVADWKVASTDALTEAQRSGPSTIRAYSSETRRRSLVRSNLRKEFEAALDHGDIRPWFQPQVSTDTGRVTGFEALARWEHPQKGVLSPQVFLPFAEQADLMERLGQAVRNHAFTAMRSWDRAGVIVPRMGVNFSSDELRGPSLIDRLEWELDQFDLTPDRLTVEVLETVFSRRPDDVITRNVTGLAALGCCIDLDDFGTGHASIASIKRFNVTRIKIDRSFVAKSDQDPSQQQMASAILTMAERLNLETLAEGVETPGEHAIMAQLGCDHVQGFGIGNPMPFEKTLDWMAAHNGRMNGVPKIGRQTG
jgi:diguanylate cyclase (GGDEF)-like protein